MFKLTKITTVAITISCILGYTLSLPGIATSIGLQQRDPCLRNNNGIGNNHDTFVELPINSLALSDPSNQIISIRIDPGNSGQMQLFENDLVQQGFNLTEINFVVAQVRDAEIRVRNTNLQCSVSSQVDTNYAFFAD